MTLLDGFVTHLGDFVTAAAPQAVWPFDRHRTKAYVYCHHPVLAGPATDDDGRLCLAGTVAVTADRLRRGMDPLREDRSTACAAGLIAGLRGEVEKIPAADEPLVEVGEEDGGLRRRGPGRTPGRRPMPGREDVRVESPHAGDAVRVDDTASGRGRAAGVPH